MTSRYSGTVSKEKLAAYQKQEEDDTLKEICLANGLTFSRLSQEGLSCVRLEMFFSGYQRMIGLNHFPNLQVLCIVGQVINKIESVCHCPRLKELWVAECQLKKIEGLQDNKHLRRLYLYSNEIRKIEGVEHLNELETLWLNDNDITIIEGLSSLKYLRELNLAENDIERIGNSLNGLQCLEKLEISGNRIYSFKDLVNLQKLPGLRELGLKSPMYSANPVGLLCNYSTHVIFHLPNLNTLDTLDVTSKALKELAETTVIKKKMYYNMKVKTLRRNLAELTNKLTGVKEALQATPIYRIHTMFSMVKQIEREVADLQTDDDDDGSRESGTESDKDAHEAKVAENQSVMETMKTKQKALKERIKKWERRMHELDFYCADAIEKLRQQTQMAVSRLVSELETGGNVRYEDGRPSDPWFTPCHDLILSRFCAMDYREHGIMGVKVHRITRIHNRILRTRFDDALAAEVEEDDSYLPTNKNTSYKKLLEYLFWVWDPELPGGQTEPARVLEEGFMDAATYKQLNKDAAVPLTNSLSLADKHRIQYVSKQNRGKDITDLCPFRQGQLVISKVYIGKSAQCTDYNTIDQNRYPKADSVFRPKKHPNESKPNINLKSQAGGTGSQQSGSSSAALSQTSSAPTVGAATNQTAEKSASGKCECMTRQCEWFLFNHELVMPEYVVDFEYITRLKPKSPFAALDQATLESHASPPIPTESYPPDDDVLNLEPKISERPRLCQFTEDLILSHTNASALTNIKVLDLYNNGLSKMKGISALTQLRRLNISFNDISRLDDVSHMNIEYLDASFNKVNSLEGLKGMASLNHLDLTWNKLQNTRDDVSILRKHCPVLAVLDLRHNHWQKREGLRLRAIGRIKSLTKLNGASVTESEATAALRMAAGSRISQVSMLALSRTDAQRPRTLMLEPYAQVLSLTSRCKPDRTSEQDNLWYSKVTTLNLDSQHISKLSNLERLENLKWASFNDNDITKIEGLEACSNLEQLSLENNCIQKIEGLSRLTKLRRLSLSHNYISSLEGCGLERLSQLQYFSVDSNNITSLLGLQRAVSLIELYIGNNQMTNVREVFYLKNLPSLVILDLGGNPVVTAADNYRLFVIYHLKSLKALDGTAIESSEGGQAKDAFGGRLTQDFVAERIGHSSFTDVRELDFPQCGIRNVDLGNGEQFVNLRSVNLEHNNLTSFSGLTYLVNLRVLCLNHNHIECIMPKPRGQQLLAGSSGNKRGMNQASTQSSMFPQHEPLTPILENLEVLHLGYNGIKDMGALQLSRLTSLKALFLQGNEISKVEGLEGLQDLRELVLDRNKIKSITEYSFMNQWNLQELHMEENRLRDLSHFGCCLENLQRLFLGMNRIQDMGELEKLEPMTNLVELSVVSNAVARRMLHRPMLVYRMPSLMVIDGIPVNEDEKTKAELYFMEQQPPQLAQTVETTLPGIGQYKAQIPVKVTNMQLMSSPYHQWSGPIHFNEEALQQELNRVNNAGPVDRGGGGGGRKRNNNRSNGADGNTLLGNTTSNKSNQQSYGSRSQHNLNNSNQPQNH